MIKKLILPLIIAGSLLSQTKVHPLQETCGTSPNLIVILGQCVQLDPNTLQLVTTTNPPTLEGKTSSGTAVWSEIPSGSINGTNALFTLANTPIAGTVRVYLNGLRLSVSAGDYTISGNSITFTAYIPETSDILVADYSH